MSKALYIAEKPSVAREFAKALHIEANRQEGYLESEDAVVTWCLGHLITMSYPDQYDSKYKRWTLETLPFLPEEFKYEVIASSKKQYQVVSRLLHRSDVDVIYVCTDSGREGEYIYRLVEQMAHVKGKPRKRVWIDSQTEEEILRGIREAKDLSEYDNLSASAYLRAKEDYLMGINFTRLLSLKYGNSIAAYRGKKYQPVSVGRVMTCVLGMVIRREREIRSFVKTPFYRVLADFELEKGTLEGEWRVTEGSRYENAPHLYRENGFLNKEDADALVRALSAASPVTGVVEKIARKKEKKNPPLLFNLAELQNVCARLFKISPDETLRLTQNLYEKQLVTYPRTDARVLSTPVAREINKNLNGLCRYEICRPLASRVLEEESWKNLEKTRYVNDSQITDHYAIIPTGQGLGALAKLSQKEQRLYEVIVRRFLSIFYPPAVYQKVSVVTGIAGERFYSSVRILVEEGYLSMTDASFAGKKEAREDGKDEKEQTAFDCDDLSALQKLRKGSRLPMKQLRVREGETTPPKRYNSGSMILAMENAGQLIEDEDLRAQIKGSGIGTSATRADMIKKLVNNEYLALNRKTQILTPTLLGEMIFDVVDHSIHSLLNPDLTASWEKGLSYVADGSVTQEEYMQKLETFIRKHTQTVMELNNQSELRRCYDRAAQYYRKR